jgi:hypothetical protein
LRWVAGVALCGLWMSAAPPRAQAQRATRAPSEAQRLYLEGKEAATAREYARAEELFGQALSRVTHLATRANILNDLGEALYELERFEDARDAFAGALEIRPNFTRAQANLEIVRWALPPVEVEPHERLSGGATFAGQVVGSYMTGAVIGGWFIFFGRIMGYKEADGQLALLSAGLVFGSTLRVAEVAEEWNYGHGARRNAVAGAFIGPLAGALAVMISDGDAGRASQVRGARIGAYFSPILATTGYAISTSRIFGGGNPARPRRDDGRAEAVGIPRPGEQTEALVSVPLASFTF